MKTLPAVLGGEMSNTDYLVHTLAAGPNMAKDILLVPPNVVSSLAQLIAESDDQKALVGNIRQLGESVSPLAVLLGAAWAHNIGGSKAPTNMAKLRYYAERFEKEIAKQGAKQAAEQGPGPTPTEPKPEAKETTFERTPPRNIPTPQPSPELVERVEGERAAMSRELDTANQQRLVERQEAEIYNPTGQGAPKLVEPLSKYAREQLAKVQRTPPKDGVRERTLPPGAPVADLQAYYEALGYERPEARGAEKGRKLFRVAEQPAKPPNVRPDWMPPRAAEPKPEPTGTGLALPRMGAEPTGTSAEPKPEPAPQQIAGPRPPTTPEKTLAAPAPPVAQRPGTVPAGPAVTKVAPPPPPSAVVAGRPGAQPAGAERPLPTRKIAAEEAVADVTKLRQKPETKKGEPDRGKDEKAEIDDSLTARGRPRRGDEARQEGDVRPEPAERREGRQGQEVVAARGVREPEVATAPPVPAPKPARTLYRQGRQEGAWWSETKEYAQTFGKPGKKVVSRTVDTTGFAAEGEVLSHASKAERSALDDPRTPADRKREIYDSILSRRKLPGFTRLEESAEGELSSSYYLGQHLRAVQAPPKKAPTPSPAPTMIEAPPEAPGRPSAEGAKEPWKMTRQEYRDAVLNKSPFELVNMPEWLAAHKKGVQDAVKAGKPVPAEVLKDYSDLAKPEAEAPSAKPTPRPDVVIDAKSVPDIKFGKADVRAQAKKLGLPEASVAAFERRPVAGNTPSAFLKKFIRTVPEFKNDAAFTVKGGKLVFENGGTFKFEPGMFGIDKAALKEGQRVTVDIESFGFKKPKKPILKPSGLGALGAPPPGGAGKEFQLDPAAEGTVGKTIKPAFASVTGPPFQPRPPKPYLDAKRVESPDPAIEGFFKRTARFYGPRDKLRRVVAAVKSGLSERFLTTHGFPKGPESALARDMIRTMPDQARGAVQRSIDDIVRILDGEGNRQALDPAGLDLLSKKVFTDDLIGEAKRAREAGKDAEVRLPKGLTESALIKERTRLDQEIAKVPSVKDALQLHRSLWKEVSGDLAKRGVISEEAAKNQTYVRHFVLDFLQETPGGTGIGRKLQDPFRPYSIERKGTRRDISTDYLNVQVKSLGDIRRHNAIQDLAEAIGKEYAKPRPGTKGGEVIEGYVEWQYKRGNAFYEAKSITEAKIAKLQGDLVADPEFVKAAQVPVSALRDSLVLGGKRKTLYIPEWLANRLDNLPISYEAGKIKSAVNPVTQVVKRWYLRTNPVRYNLRNALGDAERVNAAGRTKAFARVPEGIKMLFDKKGGGLTIGKKTYSAEEVYRKGEELGAYRSSLWHEMGEARKSKEFERFEKVSDAKGFRKVAQAAKWPFQKLSRTGQALQDVTQFREDILRAAVYLDALKDVKAHVETGKPIRHWAGSQAEIHAIAKADPLRAAIRISKETLVDYGDFTPWENTVLRQGLIPFYSWMKKNTTFWPRVVVNAAREGNTARPWLAKVPGAAYGIGKWTARVTAAYGTLQLWNNHNDEYAAREAALPAYLRLRPHVLLPNGGYLGSPTALSDWTEWFGLDRILPDLRRWERNQITTNELLINAAKTEAQEPVNRIYQALNPFLKVPSSLLGMRTFPDVFAPQIYARAFSDKAVGNAVLDVLGGDVRRFLDANKGKRSVQDVLSYYFSGSSYQPLPPEELERRILKALRATTLKRNRRRAKKGKQADVDELRNRLRALRKAG
jgi:hypothetical protein